MKDAMARGDFGRGHCFTNARYGTPDVTYLKYRMLRDSMTHELKG